MMKKGIFIFSYKYALLTILLFVVECVIALYVHDALIRPYGGDFLVVMLIYCFVRTFLNVRPIPAAIAVLIFSYLIEICQYFNFVQVLGLESYKIARIVLGTSFSWEDMIAYTLGILAVILIELTSTRNSYTEV